MFLASTLALNRSRRTAGLGACKIPVENSHSTNDQAR
jgi:hypothetical protein